MPTMQEIARETKSPYWDAFTEFVKNSFGIEPKIEYSCCSMAPGWNVKYRKGSRALCTVYPDKGFFTCMIVIGQREAAQAELVLSGCGAAVQELYRDARPMRGARWLMLPVRSEEELEDVKRLLRVRAG